MYINFSVLHSSCGFQFAFWGRSAPIFFYYISTVQWVFFSTNSCPVPNEFKRIPERKRDISVVKKNIFKRWVSVEVACRSIRDGYIPVFYFLTVFVLTHFEQDIINAIEVKRTKICRNLYFHIWLFVNPKKDSFTSFILEPRKHKNSFGDYDRFAECIRRCQMEEKCLSITFFPENRFENISNCFLHWKICHEDGNLRIGITNLGKNGSQKGHKSWYAYKD